MTTITNLSIYTIIYKLMLVIFKQIYVNYIYIFVLYINRYECIQYAKLCKLNLLLYLLIHSNSYQLLYKKKKLFHEVHSCCESEMHLETFKSSQKNGQRHESHPSSTKTKFALPSPYLTNILRQLHSTINIFHIHIKILR